MVARRNRLELLARLGYAARGAVSLMIGLLALLAAFGHGGETADSQGALRAIFSQPLGDVLILAAALGLFSFALWRICQALLDADGLGTEPKALLARLSQLVSAAVYTGLGVSAVGLFLGLNRQGGEAAARDWTAWLMTQPFGAWLVGGVGLVIIGAAFAMARKAWKASFRHRLSCSADAARWVVPLGQVGHAARAVVFLLVGGFLVAAAWHANPSEAKGLGGALLSLWTQPYGRILFGAVALGLAAFGAFEFAEARFRRIATPAPRDVLAAIRTRTT